MDSGQTQPSESKVGRTKANGVIILAKWLFALGLLYVALRWFERSQTYQPSRRMVSSVDEISAEGRDFQVLSGGKYQIRVWYLPAPADAPYKNWLLVFAHGNAGNISHRQSVYQTWLHLGFNILAFDYRGYGTSAGYPTESGTYEDLRAVLDWASSNGFQEDRVVLLGKSLGGGVVSEVAKEGKVAGLILHSTFTSLPDIGAELFPFLPVRWISTIRYDTRSKLSTINIPVLILHSRSDTLIQFHHAERNFEAAQDPKWLYEVSGGHNDPEWERAQSLQPAVNSYMRHLTTLFP